jgi:hypothetical protein
MIDFIPPIRCPNCQGSAKSLVEYIKEAHAPTADVYCAACDIPAPTADPIGFAFDLSELEDEE